MAPGVLPADSGRILPFTSIDELQGQIRASRPSMDWEGAELSSQPVRGSVVSFGGRKSGMTSTRANGDFELEGVVSSSNMVLALALDFDAPGMCWRTNIGTGTLALVQPRQSIDLVCRSNPGYLTADIDREVLESELAQHDIRPPAGMLDSNCVLEGGVPATCMEQIRNGVVAMHLGQRPELPPGYSVEQLVLSSVAAYFSRRCETSEVQTSRSYARIVARARDFIDAHLNHPISLDELCKASYASKRTLHRAFLDVVNDTPQQYILKLRLDRIRRDLAYSDEAERTVTVVSMRWGITELGRLAARYREQFGELPSDTLRRRRVGAAADCHLPAGESALSGRLLRPADSAMRHDLHCGVA